MVAEYQWEYQETVEKIDALIDRQLSEATKLPEDMFNDTLKRLREDKARLHKLVQDFDTSANQWTVIS